MNRWRKFFILIPILLAVAATRSPLSSGLVLWFRDGVDGVKVKDLSRNKNNGTASFLTVSNSPSLVSMQNTRQLTLALWIKPNSIPSEFPVLISKGGNKSPGAYGGYELTLNANGDNDLTFLSGGFYALTYHANGSLVNNHLGEWIHIVVTVDTVAQSAQFYVNGVSFTNVYTNGDITAVNFDLPNNLYIGEPDPAADSDRAPFDGDIKQVMIFNRVLSAGEIQKLYSTTRPRTTSQRG